MSEFMDDDVNLNVNDDDDINKEDEKKEEGPERKKRKLENEKNIRIDEDEALRKYFAANGIQLADVKGDAKKAPLPKIPPPIEINENKKFEEWI